MPKSVEKKSIDLRKDIFAVIFLALGVFLSICLVSYSPIDPAINSASNVTKISNLGGIVGSYISDFLFTVFGVSAYLTAIVCFIVFAMQLKGLPIRFRIRDAIFYTVTVAFAASLIHLRFESISLKGITIPGGGIVGGLLGDVLSRYLNRPGAYLISVSGFILFFLLATKLSIVTVLLAFKKYSLIGVIAAWKGILWFAKNLPGWTKVAFTKSRDFFTAQFKSIFGKDGSKKKGPEIHLNALTAAKIKAIRSKGNDVVTLAPIKPAETKSEAAPVSAAREATVSESSSADAQPVEPKILKRADVNKRRVTDDQLKFKHMTAAGYEPPPIALLDAEERKKIEIDEDALKKNSLILESKLKDFEVEGKVIAIHPGPVITMYEFEPAAGTKLNKIVNLQDDLSLAIGGKSVRVIPHLPGKAAVCIEVPNNEREIVWLKDIISSHQFAKMQTKLPIVLGCSTSGHPMVVDLTKMPHLLIAGATGSGKSVAINSIIVSLFYRSSPEDVRLILVDPKMLELSVYDGIPHLLLPVVTKPKPAVQAMRWAIKEMERRYTLMADTGTRNLPSYNEKVEKGMIEIVTPEQAAQTLEQNKEAVCHLGKLPYIVIIIDELADLMMTASQDMEESITRLAQMARAAGIHLILATQRPSVDVITGLIKANFPARIAFKVTSKHDSRTILDGMGAETLLGMGDMLFMTPQGGHILREHGSYITDSDINRVVAYLKERGEPVYDESIIAEPEATADGMVFDEDDNEIYDQALRIVAETKVASISMVQRKLRIGYNRAARLIERMEAEGVVGPADGSKPRQVLINEA